MYAKIVDGELSIAPRRLTVGNVTVYNPGDDELLSEGYLPVIFTDPPEAPEGYSYEPGWAEQEEAIVQVWTLAPLSDDISDEEALSIILGGVR